MAQPPRPCSHCGNPNLCFVPMILNYGVAMSLSGVSLVRKQGDFRWHVTQVICNQCGLTQTFTANTQQLLEKIPGCVTHTVPMR